MANHSKAKRGIPPKSDFNSWYPAIVEIADLVDKRYPIKGMDVWKPYGLSAMNLIDQLAREEMLRTGHHEYRFPLLVPEGLLDKENRLVSRLKAAREAGVDPSELRLEEEESGEEKTRGITPPGELHKLSYLTTYLLSTRILFKYGYGWK